MNIVNHIKTICLMIILVMAFGLKAQPQWSPTGVEQFIYKLAFSGEEFLAIGEEESGDRIYRSDNFFINHTVALIAGTILYNTLRKFGVLNKQIAAPESGFKNGANGSINPIVVGSDVGLTQPKAYRWDGTDWVEITLTGSGRLFAAAVYNQTVVIVGEDGSWRSTDGGINFQPGVGLFGGVEVVYNHIDSKWYAATGPGIQTSVNGHTWGPPGEFVIVNKIAVHPTTGDMALATAFTEVKVLTTSGTLTTLSNGWPANAYPSSVVYDNEGTLYASYIIYGTPNISSTMMYDETANQWEDIGGVPNADINDLEFVEINTESVITSSLFAATTNGILRMDLATGIEDEITNPSDFILYQNYPNPFNPNTSINWQLPVRSYVSLKVYDVLGKEIAALVNEEQPAGVHEIDFDASELSSGIYFYKLAAADFNQIRKMVLIR